MLLFGAVVYVGVPTMERLHTKGYFDSKTAEKVLSKPGKHKVKLEVRFKGNKGWGKYGRTFYWNGTMNVKESCIRFSHSYCINLQDDCITHFNKMKKDGPDITNSEFFSVCSLVTNVNAKLDLTVKYVFDKNHISTKDLNKLAKANNKTPDEIISYITQVCQNATFNKSFNVKRWDYKRARFNFYCLNVKDYPQYSNITDDNVWLTAYDISMFKPEVTYTVTSVKTGKVLKNVTTTKVISEI